MNTCTHKPTQEIYIHITPEYAGKYLYHIWYRYFPAYSGDLLLVVLVVVFGCLLFFVVVVVGVFFLAFLFVVVVVCFFLNQSCEKHIILCNQSCSSVVPACCVFSCFRFPAKV